jgi:hypothetical protein
MKTTIYERLLGKPMNDLLFNLLADCVEVPSEAPTKENIEMNEAHYDFRYSLSEVVGEC